MPNTYTELDTKSLSGISSITFTSIPQTYTDLVLVIKGVSSANQPANFRVGNGSVDTGSNYSRTGLSGNGSSATSYRGSSEVYFYTDNASDTNGGAVSTTYFMNYSNTTTNKTFLNRNGATSNNVRAIVGLWRSTVAINTISADFGATLTGGTASLYGIANADQGAAKATGGIITEDSQYWYHTFGASGTFTPKVALTCDYLVVAGGGGAGGGASGGGGAGGLRSTVTTTGGGGSLESALTLAAATPYTVTIGAGGAGGTTDGSQGASGVNSSIIGGAVSVTSIGGGGGRHNDNGLSGGSGGGGGYSASTGGAGTAGQGYAGGSNGGNAGGSFASPGGGGAGAVGASIPAGSSPGGAGGNGVQITALATPTGTGVNSGYYAGGGAGGTGSGTVLGGLGGGGSSTKSQNGVSGTANTGSGGGGPGTESPLDGGNGGSGLVVVRYAK